ncbi:MAG TPA: ionic transporter y4hA [Propioniciclava tarda]|nr:ionic transporter y4hA [Propioniciclava tarda]
MTFRSAVDRWHTLLPPLALIALALTWGSSPAGVLAALIGVLLAGSVLAGVHHAEVIAARVGDPFGSIILAIAVTIIEVGLIVMTMSGPKAQPTLARDTVFAAVMITLNLIVGVSLLVNAGRSGEARFRSKGSGGMLAAVMTLATVTMVLPNFTANPGPTYTPAQLGFAAVASLALYVLFVLTQTKSHRDYFLPVDSNGQQVDAGDDHGHRPTDRETLVSVGMLVASLVAVVGLAKVETHAIEDGLAALGLPASFVGVVIALLVLAPETLAAGRAAARDRVQTSFNLAYGSAVASIGLTIPVLAVVSTVYPTPLHLGLEPIHLALLALTCLVSILTVVPGRASRLQAGVHLVIFAAYVFLAASP